MKLRLNGEPYQWTSPSTTVADLVAHLGKEGIPVAVEVNKQLVRKRDHANTPLKEGDVVEVVTLVGGG
ncbi:MAG: sulfur carrier protein ThiS [Phycisphaeraceae bacterium]|nr:sulfur carrier protein ThiS [Phycisphaeraceae bacterium]